MIPYISKSNEIKNYILNFEGDDKKNIYLRLIKFLSDLKIKNLGGCKIFIDNEKTPLIDLRKLGLEGISVKDINDFMNKYINIDLILGRTRIDRYTYWPEQNYSLKRLEAYPSIKEFLIVWTVLKKKNIELEIKLKNDDILKIKLLF